MGIGRRCMTVGVVIGAAAVLHVGCGTLDPVESEVTEAGAGDADASAIDAAPCVPPACGGHTGRCGSVDACGLTFSCGDCTAPSTCQNGACVCTALTCKALDAACGTFDDGCGSTITCGTCPSDFSCQKDVKGTLECIAGQCVVDPSTCTDQCGNVTDNCGNLTTCPKCTDQLCIAKKCSCPVPTVSLYEYIDENNQHCYGGPAAPHCALPKTVAKLFTSGTDGTVPLYLCFHVLANNSIAYGLTTDSGCDNGGSTPAGFWTLGGTLGACSTTPVCGLTMLHRYLNGANGDLIYSLDAVPPSGYLAVSGASDVCYVAR